MRRLDIINSVLNIQKVLVESKIGEVIKTIVHVSDKYDVESVVTAFQKFSISYEKFGENEKEILNIFGLKNIENPKVWSILVGNNREDVRATALPYYRGINFAMEYLGKIIDLLKQDNLEYVRHDNYTSVNTNNIENQSIITVILPEKKSTSSNPQRLIKTLESINAFYRVNAALYGHQDNDLSVVAIDSGSDKSFDFLGAAKVVTAVKELIIELWDRIVFFREKKLHEKIELITKSLPILEKINSLEKNGKIEREQAEIFRRNIIDGIKGFVESGALLPEFENHSTYNPRQLMSPEPKLLAVSDTIQSNSSQQNLEDPKIFTKESEDFNSEEKELLKKMLSRESKRRSRRKPDV